MSDPGSKISKTFCVLPWTHLHTWPRGDVYPCCLVDEKTPLGNLETNTLEELWNAPMIREMRVDMLAGKEHPACSKCHLAEKYGAPTTRLAMNNSFESLIPTITENTDPSTGYNHDFKLLYWDFRFSNLCNFKCRSCGWDLSSRWAEDFPVNGSAIIHVDGHSLKRTFDYVEQFIDEVKEIYFAGGEPLIMSEHYKILEMLIERGRSEVVLRYNTNFSNLSFKGKDVIEMWRNFKNVHVFASFDGVRNVAEYVRHGTKWDIIEKNVQRVLKEPNVLLQVSPTVSILNIFHLPELIDTLLSYGLSADRIHLLNILSTPEYFRISILPEEYKKMVKLQIETHLTGMDDRTRRVFFPRYETVLKYLEEVPTNIKESQLNFKQIIKLMDSKRGENFHEIVPQLSNWFNSI
jgi:radical SAM protein with 4Fe4S-binding SPASM domain